MQRTQQRPLPQALARRNVIIRLFEATDKDDVMERVWLLDRRAEVVQFATTQLVVRTVAPNADIAEKLYLWAERVVG